MRIIRLDATPEPCTATENTCCVRFRSAYPLNCPVTVNGVENTVVAPSGALGISIG
jgi:hypothetical protein